MLRSFVFLIAPVMSPLSAAVAAWGHKSRGAARSARTATAPRQTHASNKQTTSRFIQMVFVRCTNANFNSPK